MINTKNNEMISSKTMSAGLILVIAGILWCQVATAQSDNPNYDQALADSLEADEYGMKSYVFVILKTGPMQLDDEQKVSELFRGHLENINRLVEQKKLIVAGPFGRNDRNYRGLFIFDSKDKAEVEALLQTDPAIKEKLLEAELFDWYGSAALRTYLEASYRITKKNP